MRARKSPPEKKRASLERDHPLRAKYPHAFRKSWPVKERSAQKAFRHEVKQALRCAQGRADPVVEERVDVAGVRRRILRKWGAHPLGEVIEHKQARRVTSYRNSRARTADLARVYCTRAAYVRTLPGAKPGTVEASRGRVLTVHPERDFVVRISH